MRWTPNPSHAANSQVIMTQIMYHVVGVVLHELCMIRVIWYRVISTFMCISFHLSRNFMILNMMLNIVSSCHEMDVWQDPSNAAKSQVSFYKTMNNH